jgi:hypothetical protein
MSCVYCCLEPEMHLSTQGRHIVLVFVTLIGFAVVVASSVLLSRKLSDSSLPNASFPVGDPSSKSWFLAHPVLAIVGAVVLPVPGIILRKYKGYWSKKIHAIILTLALLILLMSLFFVYAHKQAKQKEHFVSIHAKSGALLLVLYLFFCVIGLIALDPDWAFISRKEIKTVMKRIHKSLGRITLVFGYWICFSGWLKFYQGGIMYAGLGIALVASALTYLDPLMEAVDFKGKNA